MPRGTLEVGYQIGCGIDMSTSNGVTLTGTSVSTRRSASWVPTSVHPLTGGHPARHRRRASAAVSTIGLKPGIINIVPVSKKEFKGADPWVSISGFHIKIDGCVGESFIRSYAVLDPFDRRVRRHPGLLRRDQEGLTLNTPNVRLGDDATHGKRLRQRSWSPSTPMRNASMRENPAGTVSPLTSPATRPLVSRPGHRLVEVAGGERHGVAVGSVDPLGQLAWSPPRSGRPCAARPRRCPSPGRRAACCSASM